ncbi:unnamed protein product [Acanthoscelides obtectus]|uniref:Tc1-like transposase DDE domain-containing protein n=1 Tax=Acanthoscelides obtectus TaxID=200917 RepID=A0A9P0LI57_ACAOB|nr:unnamed protein product [Acanthoscelides obtectus]CAK1646613.1 hypothetical protein AOBTE_LOCUS14750 [Acanthoscelides obtectus]
MDTEKSLLPVMEECLTSDFVFQQDGAACHTSKKAIKWMEENNEPLLKWVSSSPDLSPIETLWHEMKKTNPRFTYKISDHNIEAHIHHVTSKAKKLLYMLERSFKGSDVNTCAYIYKAFVRPILEFAGPVWDTVLLRDRNLVESRRLRGDLILIASKCSMIAGGVTRQLETVCGVSRRTVQRILKAHSFHPYKIHLVQELNEDEFDRRLQFCEDMINRHNCRYWSDSNPRIYHEVHTQQRQKLNVWADAIDPARIENQNDRRYIANRWIDRRDRQIYHL